MVGLIGRPTRKKQLDIESKLKSYFEQNLSAYFTSNKTGINIKTVCKYFNRWVDQIKQAEDDDFLKRQRIEQERLIQSYDNIISTNFELLDSIKKEISKSKGTEKLIPRYLLTCHTEILKAISTIMEKKSSVLIEPDLEKIVERKIHEIMTRNGQKK